MTDKNDRSLPLGEERDGLRDNAERILGKGQPAPAPSRRPWDDDDDLPLAPRGARVPLHRVNLSDRDRRDRDREDERIARERAAYQPRNPFGGGRDVPGDGIPASTSYDSPFVKLAGITFTKRQFMTLANMDLPRLLAEARAEETQRGKLLRGVLVPALLDALTDNGFIPKGGE